MKIKTRPSAFFLLAVVLLQFFAVAAEDTSPAPSPGLLGESYCTYAPNLNCYPSTNGWPECCQVPETCPAEVQPCEEGTNATIAPVISPPSISPAPLPSGGIPGDSYCTFAPDTSCYQDGVPSCCREDPTTCPVERPACDILGGDYCTFAPDLDCYPTSDGWPACCMMDAGAACPEEPPSCDDASDVPSTVPTPAVNDFSSTIPSVDVGGDYCTWGPVIECYPSSGGLPSCCTNENEECPAERPPCEVRTGVPSTSPPVPAPIDAPTSPTTAPISSPTTPTSPTTSTSGAVRTIAGPLAGAGASFAILATLLLGL